MVLAAHGGRPRCEPRRLEAGLTVAIALTILQGIHLGLRARSLVALPVQVRAVYLGVLLLGSWPPLRALHWLQFAGTAVLLVFDYCVLARVLSLLPWNRRGPLTRARLRATFLSPPVRGSIAAALDRADASRGQGGVGRAGAGALRSTQRTLSRRYQTMKAFSERAFSGVRGERPHDKEELCRVRRDSLM